MKVFELCITGYSYSNRTEKSSKREEHDGGRSVFAMFRVAVGRISGRAVLVESLFIARESTRPMIMPSTKLSVYNSPDRVSFPCSCLEFPLTAFFLKHEVQL